MRDIAARETVAFVSYKETNYFRLIALAYKHAETISLLERDRTDDSRKR